MRHHLPERRRRDSHRLANRIVERLEDRVMLAADAANVFAAFDGTIAQSDGTDRINFALNGGNFTLANGKVILGFQLEAADGSTLDPKAIQIQDAHGNVMPALSTNPDLANKTQSLVVAQLPL